MFEHVDALGKTERIDTQQWRESRIRPEDMHVIESAEHIFVLAFSGFDHEETHSLVVCLVKDAAYGVGFARAGAAGDEDMRGEGIFLEQDFDRLLLMHVEYLSETKTLAGVHPIESRDVPPERGAFDYRQTRH